MMRVGLEGVGCKVRTGSQREDWDWKLEGGWGRKETNQMRSRRRELGLAEQDDLEDLRSGRDGEIGTWTASPDRETRTG